MGEQKKKREVIISNVSKKPFRCAGCGVRRVPDGTTPQRAAFVWTNEKTKASNPYCYECDDKLIQGLPLPRDEKASGQLKGLIERQVETCGNCLSRVENEFSATGRIDGASLIMFCGGLFQIVQNLQHEIEALKERLNK